MMIKLAKLNLEKVKWNTQNLAKNETDFIGPCVQLLRVDDTKARCYFFSWLVWNKQAIWLFLKQETSRLRGVSNYFWEMSLQLCRSDMKPATLNVSLGGSVQHVGHYSILGSLPAFTCYLQPKTHSSGPQSEPHSSVLKSLSLFMKAVVFISYL